MPAYVKDGLVLRAGGRGQEAAIRELQRDLRALGYLAMGIDGIYGSNTAWAVRALQYDLLHNSGMCTSGLPVKAPVAVTDFNLDKDGQPRVTSVTGICDQGVAGALAALMDSSEIGRVPACEDTAAANREIRDGILALTDLSAPAVFLCVMAEEESGGAHYRDYAEDRFLVVGLDHDDPEHPERITSRGYGLGQCTLCYHPPGPAEMAEICTPRGTVRTMVARLHGIFTEGLIGGTAESTAKDRVAAHGEAPLRFCAYPVDDPRYLRDCRACARAARRIDIRSGTPLYQGAEHGYDTTAFYAGSVYAGVPDAADFPCDWPYAVRRYGGTGLNGYHFQCHVLLRLRDMTADAATPRQRAAAAALEDEDAALRAAPAPP